MALRKDYEPGVHKATYIAGISGLVDEGSLYCDKCGEIIPPKEMWCIMCYGSTTAQSLPRLARVRPDDGDLLRDVPPLVL